MRSSAIFRHNLGAALLLGLMLQSGCGQDGLATPSKAELAVGDFTGKALQLTSGSDCATASPQKVFDQSLDEDINAFHNRFFPITAQYEVVAGQSVLADQGNDQHICSAGSPTFELLNLVSSVTGRVGTELSAGDLAVGTYVLRFVNAGKVIAKARFDIVP